LASNKVEQGGVEMIKAIMWCLSGLAVALIWRRLSDAERVEAIMKRWAEIRAGLNFEKVIVDLPKQPGWDGDNSPDYDGSEDGLVDRRGRPIFSHGMRFAVLENLAIALGASRDASGMQDLRLAMMQNEGLEQFVEAVRHGMRRLGQNLSFPSEKRLFKFLIAA
jgi:hypothetical protein